MLAYLSALLKRLGYDVITTRNPSDAQLFMTLRGRGFSHGFYLPPTAEDVVARLRTACTTRSKLVQTILTALDAKGFRPQGDKRGVAKSELHELV